MFTAAVLGATGYAGIELVRLLSMHPEVEIKMLVSHSFVGKKISEVYPNFKGVLDLECEDLDVDKAASEKIHPNNIKRVLRALEIYYSSGRSKTEQDEIARNNESIYHTLYIGINYDNRDVLYDRINRRVDIMLTDGLLDEVKSFYNIDGVNTASQAIGCKELKPYLDGEKTLSECVEHLKMQTRRYAKRQLTWFGRNKDIYWVYPDVDDDYVNKAITLCEEFLRR